MKCDNCGMVAKRAFRATVMVEVDRDIALDVWIVCAPCLGNLNEDGAIRSAVTPVYGTDFLEVDQ